MMISNQWMTIYKRFHDLSFLEIEYMVDFWKEESLKEKENGLVSRWGKLYIAILGNYFHDKYYD